MVAACDPRPEALRQLSTVAPGIRTYGALDAMLEGTAIETVAVCTPPAQHVEPALTALEAGCHVFVEKPLCLEPDAARPLAEAEPSERRVLMVGHNLRFHPLIERLRRVLSTGAIGGLEHVQHRWIGPSHTAGSDWGPGADLLFDRGAHCVDLVSHVAGPPTGAPAARGGGARPLTLAWNAGAVECSVLMIDSQTHCNELHLIGESGTIAVDLYRFDGLRVRGAERLERDVAERLRAAMRFPAELRDGFRWMRAGGVFRASYHRQWRAFGGLVSGASVPAAAGAAEGLLTVSTLHEAAALLAGEER